MGRDRRLGHALETRVPRHGGRLLVEVLRQGCALVCTTWGIKGKNLYLLNVLRKRLEYPALKRAVREQQSLFHANVVLIEDKASGTQLIQELSSRAAAPSRNTSRNAIRSCGCMRRPG